MTHIKNILPSRCGRPVFGLPVFCLFFCCALVLPFSAEAQQGELNWTSLWGTDTGLYSRNQSGPAETLWTGGKVNKIVQLGTSWAILTDQGIFVSPNLRDWENRSQGLPQKVTKLYENGNKSLVSMVQDTKNLTVHPDNPEIMVCAFKNAV